MSLASDRKQHYKTIDKTCYTANTLYLFVHVVYLILFIVSKLWILVYVASAMITIDLLFYLLLKKKKYYLYALGCGNQYLVFIIVCTLMVGFNAGFHFYLIGLCVVSFFTTYFSKNKNVKGSIVWAGMSIAIYLFLYFWTRYNKAHYEISSWLEATLFTIHAISVFAFVVVYLWVFIKYALSLEKKIMNESRTDELTQIHNRYGLYDYFDEENKDNKVLALFDIDDFKVINDTYGHVTGDYIIKKVAEIATSLLGEGFVCRYGGEEFVVVLPESGYFNKLETFRRTIADEEFKFDGHKILYVDLGIFGTYIFYNLDNNSHQWHFHVLLKNIF